MQQQILKGVGQQLPAFCSFAASSGWFCEYFSIQNTDSRSSLPLKHVACVSFLFNETARVQRLLAASVWSESCITHWELV